MGYLFAVFSVMSNAAKATCTKFVSKDISTSKQNTIFNGIRNLSCAAVTFIMILILNGGFSLSFAPLEILLCSVSGLAMAAFAFFWTFAVKSDAYMLVSSCNSASFVIPCIFGFAFLGEKITLYKFIAFLIIVLALYFLLRHNFKLKGRITLNQGLMLFGIAVSMGLYQAMQKIYVVNILDKDVAYYTFYTFALSGIILVAAAPFFKKEDGTRMSFIVRKNTVSLVVMAIGNYTSSYFQGLAAKSVDTIILFPMINALSLIAGGMVSSLIFKERITKSCLVGLILVFIALLLSRL